MTIKENCVFKCDNDTLVVFDKLLVLLSSENVNFQTFFVNKHLK